MPYTSGCSQERSMAVGKDLYVVLEVARGATPEVIEAAYRRLEADLRERLARLPGDELAKLRLAAVEDAWNTLSDPVRRGVYDARQAYLQEHRDAPVPAGREPAGRGSIVPVAVIVALLIAGGGYWYASYRNEQARIVAEQERVKAEAAAAAAAAEARRAEAEAEREALRLERERTRQRALEEQEFRREVERARRDVDNNQAREAMTRRMDEQRARAEEQRKQHDAARQQARQVQEDRMNYERARQAAEREAAELRRMQIERYGR
jgi:curved DNA-binding protein CbpA